MRSYIAGEDWTAVLKPWEVSLPPKRLAKKTRSSGIITFDIQDTTIDNHKLQIKSQPLRAGTRTERRELHCWLPGQDGLATFLYSIGTKMG